MPSSFILLIRKHSSQFHQYWYVSPLLFLLPKIHISSEISLVLISLSLLTCCNLYACWISLQVRKLETKGMHTWDSRNLIQDVNNEFQTNHSTSHRTQLPLRNEEIIQQKQEADGFYFLPKPIILRNGSKYSTSRLLEKLIYYENWEVKDTIPITDSSSNKVINIFINNEYTENEDNIQNWGVQLQNIIQMFWDKHFLKKWSNKNGNIVTNISIHEQINQLF